LIRYQLYYILLLDSSH